MENSAEQEALSETIPTAAPKHLSFEVNQQAGVVNIEIPDHLVAYPLIELLARRVEVPVLKSLKLKGGNNYVHAAPDSPLDNINIDILGHNNNIVIGSNCKLKGGISIRGDGYTVFIGSGTTFNSVSIICKYANVYIGKDCMFSSGIEVRTSDSHAIIDTRTQQRVNHAAGVYIGDHVWVGKHAVITKNSFVASDNIIALASFVRGNYMESNTVIAGAPGKVTRSDRSWSRDELVDPGNTDIYAWKNIPVL